MRSRKVSPYLGRAICGGWVRHRLLCGNALASTSYDALLAGEKAAAVFTDPPYNVPVNGHVGGKGKRKHREFAMATGEMSDDAFSQFLLGSLELVASHSVEDATFFACMDWRHILEIANAIREHRLRRPEPLRLGQDEWRHGLTLSLPARTRLRIRQIRRCARQQRPARQVRT